VKVDRISYPLYVYVEHLGELLILHFS